MKLGLAHKSSAHLFLLLHASLALEHGVTVLLLALAHLVQLATPLALVLLAILLSLALRKQITIVHLSY